MPPPHGLSPLRVRRHPWDGCFLPPPAALLGQELIPRKLRKPPALAAPAEGTGTTPRAGLWVHPGAGGTGGPQPPFCCCCHTGKLPQRCPGMCPEPSQSCHAGRRRSAVRKTERMDEGGSPDAAERCQETSGHLPCPRKPLRAPPASLQWVFAHSGLSQLHQPHFLPLGPRSHPMTTSIPHHTHPSHTGTQPSAGGCQGSQFLPPPQLPALGRGWHRQEPHGDKLPGGCPRPGAFGCTHPTGSSSLPPPPHGCLQKTPFSRSSPFL